MEVQERIEFLRTLRGVAESAMSANSPDEILTKILVIMEKVLSPVKVFSVLLLGWPESWSEYDNKTIPRKIPAIKALREAGNEIGYPLDLRTAKELVEKHPCVVFEGLSPRLAQLAADILTKHGCKVDIRE